MDKKKFQMIDEGFICQVCQMQVEPLYYTARDHCPNCLYSIHIDDFPGDRLCKCLGLLKPIGVEKGKKDDLKIIYCCTKCGIVKKNKMAKDDNFDLILEIMSKKS